MSHFAVLVIGDHVIDQLQPYHEYECTGIRDQYVTFVPAEETLEELKEEYKNHKKNYDSFDSFISGWHGYIKKDGVYGHYTNPNSKWDWWEIGGRWTGHFKLKPGVSGMVGNPGLMTAPAEEGYVDSCLKKNIDFVGMFDDAYDNAVKRYDEVYEVIKDLPVAEAWESVVARFENIDDARAFYHKQERVIAFNKIASPFSSLEPFQEDRETYVNKSVRSSLTTYAVVKDSVWYQKGDMGWWGVSSNEKSKEEWENKFYELMNSASDDTLFTIVDCHI